MENDNIVSLAVAREMPLARFETRLKEMEGPYILKPILEIVKLMLIMAKRDYTPNAMAVLDGTFDMMGNSSCMTFYCAEGALFPTPVTSTAFMTIEQIIEMPYDYTTIDDPEEIKAFPVRFTDWYQSYGAIQETGHFFVGMAITAWKALSLCDYRLVDYGVRQAQDGDYNVFTFVCQKLDLKFVVEIDYYRLVVMMQELRRVAAEQNHQFV